MAATRSSALRSHLQPSEWDDACQAQAGTLYQRGVSTAISAACQGQFEEFRLCTEGHRRPVIKLNRTPDLVPSRANGGLITKPFEPAAGRRASGRPVRN